MTDSESEISNPNVFTFQNVNTTVSARGPNTNISNFSFRNQISSTMYMPRNFERQRYAGSVSGQRSLYYRRETSPMSIHSACDVRPRNFQQYYNGMGSQQSVFNGRSGSPMSMRSIDSSASVSAADIAFAFKNVKFNKYDLKVIKEAYHKLMKQRIRKRIEKRRNMRLFLKGNRNKSGDDSGELGSDSSVSSDDCRSVKTSYKENMSVSSRSTRIDLNDFKKTVYDSNMLKDCTDSVRQNAFTNIFSAGTSNTIKNLNGSSAWNQKNSSNQCNSVTTQKDRFKNGFVLPSQRFNQSIASNVIPEKSERNLRNIDNNCIQINRHPKNRNCESGSEDEIFSNVTVKERSIYNKGPPRKRSLDSDDDISVSHKKKSKISSPPTITPSNKKATAKVKNSKPMNNKDENSNNFEFAKPALPIRKSKSRVQEKVIAKSKQPLTGFVKPITKIIETNNESIPPVSNPDKPNNSQAQINSTELLQNSDVSMRPSFIKRKLFTQKLDVAEKANASSEAANSPQNVYSSLQKEKNKARKLVTSQSCMNREVQDDSNLLDLIHKIVPPDHINKTNQTCMNQTKTNAKNLNKSDDDDDDRWDVTSVISLCNEHDVSDTFTDEEIFKTEDKKQNTKKNKKDNKSNSITIAKNNTSTNKKPIKNVEKVNAIKECRILVNKLPNNKNIQQSKIQTNISGANKSIVKNSAKTFWDTDFESDAESQVTGQRSVIKQNQNRANGAVQSSKQEFKPPAAVSRNTISKNQIHAPKTPKRTCNTKNTSVKNNTLDNSRKFNITPLSLRSHHTSRRRNKKSGL